MPRVLTVAIGVYDHTRDLVMGNVSPDGVELSISEMSPEAIFSGVEERRAWDIAEFSLAKYAALRSRGVDDLLALPVFPSRVFRQGSIFVPEDSDLHRAEELAGRRVGVPVWVQTAGVFARGWLQHDVSVPMSSIEWIQGGVDIAGRRETVDIEARAGLRIVSIPDRPLDDMLLRGELDAIMTARPPQSFLQGRTRQLLDDPRKVAIDCFRRTGIFPIMHVVVVRTELLERDRWLAPELIRVFEESKRRSLERMRDLTASCVPVPALADEIREFEMLFGRDLFAYGIDANRPTLAAFSSYCDEQGITRARLSVEELFETA